MLEGRCPVVLCVAPSHRASSGLGARQMGTLTAAPYPRRQAIGKPAIGLPRPDGDERHGPTGRSVLWFWGRPDPALAHHVPTAAAAPHPSARAPRRPPPGRCDPDGQAPLHLVSSVRVAKHSKGTGCPGLQQPQVLHGGRARAITTSRGEDRRRAGLLLGDDGQPRLHLPAHRQVSPGGRRRTGPGGLSSMTYRQAS